MSTLTSPAESTHGKELKILTPDEAYETVGSEREEFSQTVRLLLNGGATVDAVWNKKQRYGERTFFFTSDVRDAMRNETDDTRLKNRKALLAREIVGMILMNGNEEI